MPNEIAAKCYVLRCCVISFVVRLWASDVALDDVFHIRPVVVAIATSAFEVDAARVRARQWVDLDLVAVHTAVLVLLLAMAANLHAGIERRTTANNQVIRT